MLEHHYIPVLISRPHDYLKDAKWGIVRLNGSSISVEVMDCPVENGNVVAEFRNTFRNGVYRGRFIAAHSPAEFVPTPIDKMISYGVVEPDMQFEGKIPAAEEIEKYFSRTGPTFLYLRMDGKSVSGHKAFYSLNNGWTQQQFEISFKLLKNYFLSILPNKPKVVILEKHQKTLGCLDWISKLVGLPCLKMDRIDLPLEELCAPELPSAKCFSPQPQHLLTTV